ncbi:MAG: SCO family protein [Chloroflexi bacterium]|nr:MAG: SCO family protein [Chloroflexota bacterium]
MRRRARSFIAALLAAALVVGCSAGKLVGDPLPSQVAPDFTLTDGPTGEVLTLSSFHGRVVVLTFLYTSCFDSCPLTAETLRTARDKLGNSANDVSFVAVSVDPNGDTPATTRKFVQDHRVEGTLRYLIGSQSALARVWQAYGIAQAVSTRDVLHSDVIYLIDKNARGRVVLHSTVTPDDLATDLAILLKER